MVAIAIIPALPDYQQCSQQLYSYTGSLGSFDKSHTKVGQFTDSKLPRTTCLKMKTVSYVGR
jgi:hypothetical protein